MRKKLRILHTVEFYSPSVGGAQEVVKQLSEHMVAMGHQVTVATTKIESRNFNSYNGVKIKEFEIQGNQVRGYTGKDIDKFKKFLVDGKFDVVMNYAAQQWTTDLTFQVIDKIKSKKYLVPCGFSGLYDPIYKKYFEDLPDILKKYDRTIYLSNDYRDIDFARLHNITNTVFIPNGADEREFTNLPEFDRNIMYEKFGIPVGSKVILCVSNHTGQKGHKEAIAAFLKANINNAALVIVGDINLHAGCYNECLRSQKINFWKEKFLRRDGKTIHNIHISRKDTLELYSAAFMFIFLSNIECSPLVLFEASAAGKPFISTNCGNSIEIARWMGNGHIVKTRLRKLGYVVAEIDDASKQIEGIFKNAISANDRGQKARKAWLNRYTWQKLAQKYLDLYLS